MITETIKKKLCFTLALFTHAKPKNTMLECSWIIDLSLRFIFKVMVGSISYNLMDKKFQLSVVNNA